MAWYDGFWPFTHGFWTSTNGKNIAKYGIPGFIAGITLSYGTYSVASRSAGFSGSKIDTYDGIKNCIFLEGEELPSYWIETKEGIPNNFFTIDAINTKINTKTGEKTTTLEKKILLDSANVVNTATQPSLKKP